MTCRSWHVSSWKMNVALFFFEANTFAIFPSSFILALDDFLCWALYSGRSWLLLVWWTFLHFHSWSYLFPVSSYNFLTSYNFFLKQMALFPLLFIRISIRLYFDFSLWLEYFEECWHLWVCFWVSNFHSWSCAVQLDVDENYQPLYFCDGGTYILFDGNLFPAAAFEACLYPYISCLAGVCDSHEWSQTTTSSGDASGLVHRS